VALGLALPRILVIVVTYLVVGLNELAAVLAVFLIILPNVVVQMQEGIRSLDGRLIEMARVFRLPPGRFWWRVILPQLAPFFWGTARSTLSLAWKMVVLVELLGRSNGV
ncbi:ABC transporter permease subunit, partial [Klebsiella pneumoniae]